MAASFRVLCAVDLSPGTEDVLSSALALSQGQGGDLTVVNVTTAEHHSDARTQERAMALATMRQMAADAGVPLRVTLRHGRPATVVLDIAHRKPFDLVVLGTHQQSRSNKLWSVSESAHVTRRSNIPVLVVPIRTGARRTSTDFKVVLCPTDLSPTTAVELEQAARMALWSHGRVALLHVFEGAPSEDLTRHSWYFSEWEYRRLLLRAAWLRVEATTPPSARVGSLPTQAIPGRPSDEIVRIACDLQADLIVMRKTPRGPARRRVFGSTVERVRQRALCPVLVLPAPERALPTASHWPTRRDEQATGGGTPKRSAGRAYTPTRPITADHRAWAEGRVS